MPELHLWWNGYDHAPGATAEDAKQWLMEATGLTAEECEGDGWERLPDDMRIRDPDGRTRPDSLTAIEYANSLAGTDVPPPDHCATALPAGAASPPEGGTPRAHLLVLAERWVSNAECADQSEYARAVWAECAHELRRALAAAPPPPGTAARGCSEPNSGGMHVVVNGYCACGYAPAAVPAKDTPRDPNLRIDDPDYGLDGPASQDTPGGTGTAAVACPKCAFYAVHGGTLCPEHEPKGDDHG